MDARTTAGGAVDWLRSRTRCAPRKLAVALILLLAGCQADPNMQLVERELRLQDSHIFELEEHLSDCHAKVAAYRREIESLRRQLDGKTPAGVEEDYYNDWDPDTRLRPPRPSGPSLPEVDEGDEVPSRRSLPSDAAKTLESYEAPDAAAVPDEAPLPNDGEPPAPFSGAPGEGVSFPPSDGQSLPPQGQPMDEELPDPNVSGSAGEVEQIGLRLLVRYHPAEDTPVELQTLIEPQDADAQQVIAEGDVSLMVMATDGGSERPLARWDFAEEEARRHWKRSPLGMGLLFQLPWPGTPQPGTYRLWARMVGDDGRKHLGSADFEIQASPLAQRPTTAAPIQLVLPEPEPAHGLEGPRPLELRSPAEDDLATELNQIGIATPDSPQEPRPASAAQIAWKASVEAARLPRLPQPDRASSTEIDNPPPQVEDDGRVVPWSPERPESDRGAGPQTANDADAWSPYR